jgi:hypothetical protein
MNRMHVDATQAVWHTAFIKKRLILVTVTQRLQQGNYTPAQHPGGSQLMDCNLP